MKGAEVKRDWGWEPTPDDQRAKAPNLSSQQRFLVTLLAVLMLAAAVGGLSTFNERPVLVAAVAGIGMLTTQRLARARRGTVLFWPAALAFWPFFIMFIAYAGWLILEFATGYLGDLIGLL